MNASPARSSALAPRPHRPLRAVAVAVLLAVGVLGVAGVPAARAGDYTVAYCHDEAGAPRPLVDWSVQGSSQPGDRVTEGCAAPAGGMRADWTNPAAKHPRGVRTGWTLNARSGISIVGWDVGGRGLLSANGSAFELAVAGNPKAPYVGTQCRQASGCKPNSAVGGRWSGSTTQATMHLVCRSAADVPTCDGTAASIVVRNLVTYRDATPPTASGAVRSPLTGGGLLQGTIGVAGAAADAGVGMRRLALQVDGREVAGSEQRCAPPYARQQPCVASLDASFDVDTTTIADGTHGATVVAIDGADNAQILWSGPILVGNAGTVGPGTDVGVRGAPNGDHAADDAKVTAGWPATSRAPSKSKAVQRRCRRSRSYRRRHDLACNGRPARRSLTVSYSGRRENLVRGRLTTGAGRPIAGAAVRIAATPRAVGLAPRVVATSTTDADGRFVGRVPTALGSASLSVDWLARARDTVPAASLSLRRVVRASTTFSTSPKRSVRRGRTLVLRGTLRAATGVRQGNAVAIQANAGNGWRAVRTVRSNAQGRWRAAYVVPRQLRGRYRFRAVVTPSAAYPFGIGRSATRTVRIR